MPMAEREYNVMDEGAINALLVKIVPPLAAVVLIVGFSALGMWQLDRAAQKEALAAMFAKDAPSRSLEVVDEPAPFERLQARGRLEADRQVLIDNIVKNGRIGYYVITALETGADEPLLLVNRGWVAKQSDSAPAADIAVGEDWRTVRGRAGNLPRVGIRSGEAFAGGADAWPRVAVYPTHEEVAAELGRDVRPFALLLDPEAEDGFLRVWEPAQSGPMTHYGYAFQWFAMAIAVIVIAGWQLRKRRAAP